MSRNPKDAKPRLEIINDIPYVIVHDLHRFTIFNKYKGNGERGYDIDEFEIKFTIDEMRVARFSINQGSAGRCLRIALDRVNDKPEYHFLMESLEDIQELVDFGLNYKEKWPQD